MSIAMTDIFSSYRTVGSKRDAVELAALLVDPERERPAVVISTTKNGPTINPATVAERLGSRADVYLLASASLAYDFEDAMPRDTSVYGGAARSYPPGTEWSKHTSKSMVRLAYSDADGPAAIAHIEEDVAAMAPGPATVMTTVSRPEAGAAPATVDGVVSMLLAPDGVLVKLETGMAQINTSVLAPGIQPGVLFTVGQKVTGTVRDRIMTLTSGIHTPADAADHAVKGLTFPALVASEKTVVLFPGLLVRHASGAPTGSVIAVRVELSGRADGKAWKLSNAEPDAEVADALPFFHGGEPWISFDPAAEHPEPAETPAQDPPATVAPAVPAPAAANLPPVPSHPDEVFTALDLIHDRIESLTAENQRLTLELQRVRLETPAVPLPSPAFGGAEMERLRAQVALMTREKIDMVEDLGRALADADDLAAENARIGHTNENLREQIRIEQGRAARARQLARDIDDVTDAGPLFQDPADQFRHEVYLEWARRIPAGSKAETPLAEYGFADGFLTSVEEIQGIDRSKIVAVAVEVLTGLADSMPGRDMHRLRGGLPGTSCIEDPVLGTAWRVALQVKTASARRMHFWRGTDGKIVFATVGVHDDMDI